MPEIAGRLENRIAQFIPIGVFDRLDYALFALDKEWRISFANHAAERFMGQGNGELLGHVLWQEVPIFGGGRFESECRRAMREQQPREFEEYDQVGDVWWDVHMSPSTEGLTVEIRDVTRRKREELAQADKAKWYSALVNSIGGIVWVADAQTFQFSFVSQQAEKVLGYPVDQWLKDPNFWRNHVHPDDLGWCEEFCRAASAQKRDHDFEYRMIGADGRIVWLRDIVNLKVEDGVLRLRGIMLDITEQKQAQERLERKEEHFRKLVENAWDAIGVVTPDGTILYVSPSVERILGYKPDEMLGRQGYEWVHPDDIERVGELLNRVFNDGRADLGLEYRAHHKNGSWRTLELIGQRFIDEQERTVAVINVRDISERSRIEKQLRESEARFRMLFEMNGAGMAISDIDGRFLQVNPAFCQMLGYSAHELLQKRIPDITHPDDWSEAQHGIEEVRRGERSVIDFEKRYIHKNGSIVWGHLTAIYVSPEDQPIYCVATVQDITERKSAATHIVRWKNRYEAAIAASGQLLYEYDISKDQVIYGGNLHGMLGYSPEEMSGGLPRWIELIHPDDRATFKRETERVHRTQDMFHLEYRVRHKDGRILAVSDEGRFYRLPDGSGGCMIGFVSNITERKNTLLQLASAKEAAEAANRAKDDFLAALSHELRTPLNPVLILTSELERSDELAPSVRQDFAMIRKNVELEARIIDDLLDLTRITHGKLEMKVRPVEAHALVNQAIEVVRTELDAKQLVLALDLSADDHRVDGDPVRLQQVFRNVLKNAVKFTPPGGTVTIRSRNTGDRKLLLEFSDTGIGISAEDLPTVFEAFVQGGGVGTHLFGGLGLGLTISKEIVGRHHGRIWAESAGRGSGSSFYVELPLAAGKSVAEAVRPPETAKFAPTATGSRILLVEDHEPTRVTLARLLTRQGYRVASAESVAAARELAAANQYDLVISDIGLPDGNGQDLMVELHEKYGLTGVALSGYGMEDDIKRSLASGFAVHLTKPVDMQALRRAITDVEKHAHA